MSTVAPPQNRPSLDIAKIVMWVWSVAVLTFMFVPIGFIVAHSFNTGNSLVIWSGGPTTKWWGDLFDTSKSLGTVMLFLLIVFGVVGVAAVVERFTDVRPRSLRRWATPVGLIAAIVITGLSSGWFLDLFKRTEIGGTLRNSFIAAIGGTLVAVALGGLSGVALARHPGRWTTAFMFLLFLILVTPEIMDAIALLGWFVRLGGPFSNSVGPVNYGILRLWVGQSLYTSAVVTLIVRARLSGLDASLEEAAGDLGAPPGRAFRQITLPLISSALLAGGLLSFTLCLDNTIISSLVSAKGSTTFPVYVLGTAKSTTRPFVGVAAVVLFGITLLALAFVGTVLKRSGESSSKIAATLAGG